MMISNEFCKSCKVLKTKCLLTFCMLGKFSCFFVACWLLQEQSSTNGLDPDQDRHSVCPGLGPNCLQHCLLSADDNVYNCILEIGMYAVKKWTKITT